MSMSAREDAVGGPRVVVVHEPEDANDSSVYDGTSEEEDEQRWQDNKGSDLPSEYWHIQKLVKYMKAGNQTATIVALACLKDHDLTTEVNQMAIRDIGGLEVLINLLETDDFKCKLVGIVMEEEEEGNGPSFWIDRVIELEVEMDDGSLRNTYISERYADTINDEEMGALSVLSKISSNLDIRKHITDLGAVPLLVNLLSDPARDLQGLAAFTISNVAKIRKARKIVRKFSGLPKLVDLLDVKPPLLLTPMNQLEQDDRKRIEVVHGSAKAIWSLSQSNKNKEAMRRTGCIKLLARLLQSVHEEIVVFTVGTIEQCASQSKYQLAIQAEGMIGDMVRYLSSPNVMLKKHCASAIFKCAEDSVTRDMVRQHGGLDPLVAIIKDESIYLNKPLLAAATGAIWKCAISVENVRRLDDLNTVTILVGLLVDEDEEVLTNIVGALSQCAKLSHNREAIRVAGGIQPLVQLLNFANKGLLENVARCLGECAHQVDCLAEMEKIDAIRLLWSLLRNPCPKVQANAAWALVPCIENAKGSAETVRSFVGGLELIVNLLQSEDVRVLACVCAALAKVAADRDNLAIITDHGVVPMLARLVLTEDDTLREHLASAIANCCSWSNNCYEFGRLGAVTPLVGYMMSKERKVHRTTALALCQLSQDPFNCVTLHQSGVVPYLLKTIGSPDEVLQEASAGCLSNIRKLALASERAKF